MPADEVCGSETLVKNEFSISSDGRLSDGAAPFISQKLIRTFSNPGVGIKTGLVYFQEWDALPQLLLKSMASALQSKE